MKNSRIKSLLNLKKMNVTFIEDSNIIKIMYPHTVRGIAQIGQISKKTKEVVFYSVGVGSASLNYAEIMAIAAKIK